MIELGRTYKTVSGLAVEVLTVNSKNRVYPVIALVTDNSGEQQYAYSYTKKGKYNPSYDSVHSLDLVDCTPKTESCTVKMEEPVIELGKRYKTRNGLPVEVVKVDVNNHIYTVIALVTYENTGQLVYSYTKNGKYNSCGTAHDMDLVECTPWDDFKCDELVMVRNADYLDWEYRHFAAVVDGRPSTWAGKNIVTWNECRTPTAQERAARVQDAKNLL